MDTPIPSFADFIAKPKSIGAPKSIMLYGAPGTRKTSLSAELIKRPGVRKILYLDIDNGTEALVGDEIVAGAVSRGDITIVPLSANDPSVFQKITTFIQDVSVNDYGYDFVVLDTLNLAQEVAAGFLLANTKNSSGQIDTRAAWAEVSKWTMAMARLLHEAPHLTGIFIVHEKNEAEDTGRISIKPKLSGSAKDMIASIPSVVIHLGFEETRDEEGNDTGVKLVADLGDSDKFVSKNRYRLPTRIEDFSLLKMYDLIDQVRGVPTADQVAQAAK